MMSTGAHRRPVILAVDDVPDALARIRGELARRYGADYRVLSETSATEAQAKLEELRAEGDDVALVLADQWMPEATGAELLARVRVLHPDAKRGLLIDWGAWGHRPTADAILRAMALGHIDYYVIKPWRSPDEYFHRIVTEFVHEWSRAQPSAPMEVAVVGDRWSRRAHELAAGLAGSGIPYTFHASDSPSGRRLLRRKKSGEERLPVVVLFDGRVLVDPSDAELAGALGVSTRLERKDFDLVVVGAGPAGLAAAVYGSSEGLRTLVVERGALGGQAGASSLIRNYLGFSRGVSGSDLATRAYQQAWVFGTTFLIARRVDGLRAEQGRHVLAMSDGTEASARAVILATGVSYRRLGVPALEQLTGAGVFYGASASEAQALGGQTAYVVGGGNSAGQAAVHLSRRAAQVVLVIRGTSLAEGMSRYLCDTIEATANIAVRSQTEVVDGGGEGRLERLSLRDNARGDVAEVEAAGLFVLIGARPRTGWLPAAVARDPSGYVMTGADLEGHETYRREWSLERPPLPLETSSAGVFCAGDVRHRAIKRVASAVGEGSIAIPQVHEYLERAPGGAAPTPAAGLGPAHRDGVDGLHATSRTGAPDA